MTKKQRLKLDTLIGKLEAFQHAVKDDIGLLTEAKSLLLRFRQIDHFAQLENTK